jgi:hypothetical protein
MANDIMLEAQFVAPETEQAEFGVRFFPSSETDDRLQESAAVMRKLRQSTVSLPVAPLECELDPISGEVDAVETLMLTLLGVDEDGRVQFNLNLLMRDGRTLLSDSTWVLTPRESRVAWEALTAGPNPDDPITLPERPQTITAELWPESGAESATHRLEIDVNDFLWARLLGTIRTCCDLVQTEAHLELLDNEATLASLNGAGGAADEYRHRYLWVRLAEESTFEVAVKAFSESGPERDLVSGSLL